MIPAVRCRVIGLLAGCAIAWSASSVARAQGMPEIYGLSPDEGPAGTRILLKGKHLKDTVDVVFSAGSTTRLARFRVVSDRELEVIAPFYLREGTAATVAVVTGRGVTVGMPPDVLTVDRQSRAPRAQAAFYHVEEGAEVPSANGITVIEAGGIVRQSHAVGMHFVKRRGVLFGFSNGGGVVFYERGAIFGPNFQNPSSVEVRVKRVMVPEIGLSLGIAPFLFRAPATNPGAASRVPRILGITPPAAIYGQIITLSGAGFTGTTEVFFSNGRQNGLTPAGFQVVSDRVLEVQVPESGGSPRPKPPVRVDSRGRLQRVRTPWVPPQFVIVVNPKGAAVTVPADFSGQPLREVSNLFEYVGPGAQSTRVNGVYYVASGGVALPPAALVFLKSGGQLAAGNVGAVFCEPEAILSNQLDRGKKVHHVESIVASPLREPFRSFIP